MRNFQLQVISLLFLVPSSLCQVKFEGVTLSVLLYLGISSVSERNLVFIALVTVNISIKNLPLRSIGRCRIIHTITS